MGVTGQDFLGMDFLAMADLVRARVEEGVAPAKKPKHLFLELKARVPRLFMSSTVRIQ